MNLKESLSKPSAGLCIEKVLPVGVAETGHGLTTCILWIRGFHVGDARLGGVRIFHARIKIQHDAQWSVLTRASIF